MDKVNKFPVKITEKQLIPSTGVQGNVSVPAFVKEANYIKDHINKSITKTEEILSGIRSDIGSEDEGLIGKIKAIEDSLISDLGGGSLDLDTNELTYSPMNAESASGF